jgi:hypothetical protein
MSRTKRYVPHWVIEQHLHPWIDPETGEPHVWGSVHRRLRQKQREDARLRGDDGRCPNHNRWNNRWRNPMDEVRTAYRRQIAEGIEDHFDALEDHGCQFDYQGNCINDGWYDDEEMDLPDWWYDPFREKEFYPDCAEPEEEPYDPWVDDIYYDDPWDHYPL